MVEFLNEETDFNGGIIVVKPTENRDYSALRKQDGLFYVSTNGIKDGELFSENKLITCITKVVHAYREWDEFLETAELPSLRFIVSNTTEAGIQVDAKDQFTDSPPHEFPAKLTCWLYRRFTHFSGSADKGCVLLPCELIEDNGIVLRDCILKYIDWWSLGNEFKDWILNHNIFCDTLVDRIVPGFPTARKEELFEQIGVQDNLLVDVEPYHIFAIQSSVDLKDELPFPLTDLNVVFTNNIEVFRELKVRILNGAHTSMVPVGYLSGIESVGEAKEDKAVSSFIESLLVEEIVPSLDFPFKESMEYVTDVLDRFRNPFIHHRLINISLNSITKFKTRLLPSLLGFYEKKNNLPSKIVFSFASLIWFYRGKRKEEVIPLNDNSDTISFFKNLWDKEKSGVINKSELVKTILEKENFWEMNLTKIDGLEEQIVTHLKNFRTEGYKLPKNNLVS